MPQVNPEVKIDPKVKLIADLGAGTSSPHFGKYPKAKIVRFDINSECNPDVRCDVRAIPEPDEKYDIVHASHVLEHFPFWEARQVVGEWIRILKIGGELQVKVPNVGWAAEEIIKSAKDENYNATFAFGAIFGTKAKVQTGSENDPQFHRCGYTVTGLRRLANLFPCLENIEITETMARTELTLKAIKAKSSKPMAILPIWASENQSVDEAEKEIPSNSSNKLAAQAISLGAMQKNTELISLIEFLKHEEFKTIVEIGTARGGTFWLLCQLAPKNATLISVDLPGGPFGGGYMKQEITRFKTFAQKGQKLHFLREDSHLIATQEKLKAILGDKEIDLLFIDGDHSYEGVKKDWEMYSPLVKEGGIVIFHDILFHPFVKECEVERFWKELKNDREVQEFIDPHERHWGGIGTIRKAILSIQNKSQENSIDKEEVEDV